MVFANREDAGKSLISPLEKYRGNPNAIIIALPRGGVPVAYEVASALNLPLDITCPRKVGAPGNPEYAIGAITETGEGILNEDVIQALGVSQEYLDETIEREKKEALHRLDTYRQGLSARQLKGKVVIIIDDGLATGSTMLAAVRSVKSEGATKIVVAIPVAPLETLKKLEMEVDELHCLETPPLFYAVGQFYEVFGQTTDDEVISLMRKAK